MIYKTGRERRLTIEGTLHGDFFHHPYTPSLYNQLAVSYAKLLAPWGAYIEWAPAEAGGGISAAVVLVVDGAGGTDSDAIDFNTAFGSAYGDLSADGDVLLYIDVEEMVEVSGIAPGDVAEIDGLDFPSYGGTATNHGIPATRARWFWQTKVGGEAHASASLDSVTATSTTPIATAVEIDVTERVQMTAVQYADYEGLPIAGPFWDTFTAYCALQASQDWGPAPIFSVNDTTVFYQGTAETTIADDSVRVDISYDGMSDARVNGAALNAVNPNLLYDALIKRRDVGGNASATNATAQFSDGLVLNAVSCTPHGSRSDALENWAWERHHWDGDVDFGTYPAVQTGGVADGYGPFRCYIETQTGQDSRDWRLLNQAYPYDAIEIEHDASRAVTSTDALTTGANTIATTSDNWEGHRYLSVPYAFTANRTLTLHVGGKRFRLPVTNGTGTAVVDLCRPTNLPSGKVWTRDGRWPLDDGPTSDPDESTGTDAENGWTFGILSRPASLTVDGLAGAEFLDLGPCALVRQTSSEVRVLVPFQKEQRVWTSETDTTYGDYDLHLLSDGKQCGPVCFRFRVVPFSGDPSLAYQTNDQVADFITGTILGWTATAEASPSFSPYAGATKLLGPDHAACNISPYAWNGGTTGSDADWTDQTSLTPTATLLSALLSDEVQVYSGCGNPLEAYDPGDSSFPLRYAQVTRGQAEGLVFGSGGGAEENADVELVAWSGGSAAGDDSTDVQGIYRTEEPYATGNQNHRTRLTLKPNRYEEWTPQNRYVGRTDFLWVPETYRSFLRIHSDLRRALGFVQDGTLWLWFFDVGQQSADLSVDARDTGITAEWCAGAWKTGHGMLILVGDGGEAKLYTLDYEGGTPTLSTTLGDATSGDIFSTDDTTFRAYRLDGGTLKWHVTDVDGTELDSGDTNLTGLDEEPIALDQSVAGTNGVQVAVLAVEGGTRKVFLSSDGINFS